MAPFAWKGGGEGGRTLPLNGEGALEQNATRAPRQEKINSLGCIN